jgi:putative transcriptional regulator
VIVYRLDERMDQVRDRTGRRPSFKEIAAATGVVSVSVLSNMRTKLGYTTTTRQIDALCRYFCCQPGDLMQWRPDQEETTAGDQA